VRIDGIGDVGYLKDVFHVSALSFNLISEGLLDRAGYELTGKKGTRTWKFEDGTLFLTAQLNSSNLYQADMSYLGVPMLIQEEPEYNALISKAEAIDTLHRTLGHISVQRVQDAIHSGHVKWDHDTTPTNFVKKAVTCKACMQAKSRNPSHSGVLERPEQVGSLFYVDVWGPAEEAALITEAKYTLGFVEAKSRRL
jgi:hypothetical protein